MGRTFVIVKPHAMQSGDERGIIRALESLGLEVVDTKRVHGTRDLWYRHYIEYEGTSIHRRLVDTYSGHDVLCVVLRGKRAVRRVRANIWDIRSQYGISRIENALHASSSKSAVQRERRIWGL